MALFRLLLALCMSLSVAFTIPGSPALSTHTTAVARVTELSMGRGDKRTAKGKRKAKSFGKSRPRNSELRKRAAAVEAASE